MSEERDRALDQVPYARDVVAKVQRALREARALGRNDGIRESSDFIRKRLTAVQQAPLVSDKDKALARAIRDTHVDILRDILEQMPREKKV